MIDDQGVIPKGNEIKLRFKDGEEVLVDENEVKCLIPVTWMKSCKTLSQPVTWKPLNRTLVFDCASKTFLRVLSKAVECARSGKQFIPSFIYSFENSTLEEYRLCRSLGYDK